MSLPQPSQWPYEELEHLGRCVLCGSSQRDARFENLTDRVFRCAPGSWTLNECRDCHVLYLDPRPNEASIGRAYETYFTHGEVAASAEAPRSLISAAVDRARRTVDAILRRGYLNRRYGYAMAHAAPLLAALMISLGMRPKFWRQVDYWIRHLPAPSDGARLLDVGCGNGTFLKVATELGYETEGIDPDPEAVAVARASGLIARQGLLPGSGHEPGTFDHITLSHVLEHLHRPREALREALELLRPSGRLWLTQPNLRARGLERFGPHWRGLEPPRHLWLYPPETLADLLESIGFVGMQMMPAEQAAEFFFRQSACMSQGLDPYGTVEPQGWDALRRKAEGADREAQASPERAETLTVVAFKPPAGTARG